MAQRRCQRGIMQRQFALVIAITLAATGVVFAQPIDERAAQAACQDDAFRYCQATIPDRDRTLACLVHNKDSLSGACRTVLAEFFPPEPKKTKRAKRAPVSLAPAASR
jgi:hypothetical protein